jgi:hypothetical protein
MLRRVALSLSIGALTVSLSGCGGWFDVEEREPWRAAAEQQCLSAGLVQETADIRVSEAIEGPGVCGLDHPFKVSAFEGVTPFGSSNGLVPMAYDANSGLKPPDNVDGALPLQPDASFPSMTPSGSAQSGPEPFRIAVSRAETMSCAMIPRTTRWLAEHVQPAAMAHFGVRVVEMKTAGAYNCRRRNHARTGRWSEHAFANALDVSGFVFEDGRQTTIRSGWRGSAEERAFWRDIAFGGCGLFNTVLGPGSDGHHENHLHLDLARHSSKRTLHVCRPRVPEGFVPIAQRFSPAGAVEPEFTGSIVEPKDADTDF